MATGVFEQLVIDVLDTLPAEFATRLENVEILIEPRPTHVQRHDLGLDHDDVVYGYYEGVPLTESDADDVLLPATIVIFQEPLEQDFPDPTLLREEIRRTVLHEIAHHFGISDERLRELGAY